MILDHDASIKFLDAFGVHYDSETPLIILDKQVRLAKRQLRKELAAYFVSKGWPQPAAEAEAERLVP